MIAAAEVRLAVRQTQSKPKVDAFRHWAKAQLTCIPGKSNLATAFRYGLSRWSSLCLFLEDGRVAIDNNAAERALRPNRHDRFILHLLFKCPETETFGFPF